MDANRSVIENLLNNLVLKSSLGKLLAFTANHSAKHIIKLYDTVTNNVTWEDGEELD